MIEPLPEDHPARDGRGYFERVTAERLLTAEDQNRLAYLLKRRGGGFPNTDGPTERSFAEVVELLTNEVLSPRLPGHATRSEE